MPSPRPARFKSIGVSYQDIFIRDLSERTEYVQVFGLVGNEALSACKAIAELWDGRLRGGHWSG